MDFNRYDQHQHDRPRLHYDSYTERTMEIDRANARLARIRFWVHVAFVLAEIALIAAAIWYVVVHR